MNSRTILVIIQVRLSSNRLPAKALLPLAGMPCIVLCALRAANTGLPVIVTTSIKEEDGIIAHILQEQGISCVRGSLEDVLSRFSKAAVGLTSDDLIIRLTADNTFPDGHFLGLLLKEFNSELYDYLGTSSPADGLPYGLSAEIFTVKALRAADQQANTKFDREHVTPFMKRNFRAKQFIFKHALPTWHSLRCTLDNYDDYLLLFTIFQHVNATKISWWELVEKLAEFNASSTILAPRTTSLIKESQDAL